jgi:hypothetical protein
VRADDDQRRLVGLRLRFTDRVIERLEVVDVLDAQHVPPVRLESLPGIVAEREVGIALDGDAVVVVKTDQLPEPEVTGEGCGLMRHAFHDVAVARHEVRVVIDDRVPLAVERRGEVRFGDRHPDCVADSLSQRAGRGLDARRVAVLRVPGGAALPLPEVADVIE